MTFADYNYECPKCGGGPIYQDRLDAELDEAHCDDCGETISKEEYEKIKEQYINYNKE